MPGVETGILAAFNAPGKFAGQTDERAGSSSGEGDFDRAMQAALSPPRQRPEARNSSAAPRHSPAPMKASSHSAPAKATNLPESKTLSPAEKSEKAASTGKDDAPAATGDDVPNVNGFPGSLEAAQPSIVPSLLSLFFGSAETTPQPGKPGVAEKQAASGTVDAFGTTADVFSAAGTPPVRVASGTSAHAPLTDGSAVPTANQALPAATAGNKPGTAAALFLDPPVIRPGESGNFKPNAPATDTGTNPSSDNVPTPSVCRRADGTETVSTLPSDANAVPTDEKTIPADDQAVPADEKTFSTDPNTFQTNTPGDGKIDLDRQFAAGQAAAGTGTGVASTLMQMKNPQKANKVAGLEVKDLPVGASQGAREKILPAPLLATPVPAADNRDSDPNLSFSAGNSQTPVMEKSPLLNVVDLPSLADARMRAIERAHDMVALHAMRLVESKSDALSVVIKPAVGTELSLELRQRDGGVEAQATLTRGDHEFLSQHWPELQQRLEQRGIKLGALAGEAELSAHDNGNFQRQQPSQEEAAQQASAFAEFATAGNFGGATARMAVAHDGWESWA